MAQRMMCTACFEVTVPDTVVEGSDRMELLAWCCLGLPGLLYCGWRHLGRAKACPCCGGGELLREARAAARGDDWPVRASCVRTAEPVDWPLPLATPRARLRWLAADTLLLWVLLAAWAGAALGLVHSAGALGALGLLSVVGGTRLAQRGRALAQHVQIPPCRAWDEHGRPLRIERV